METVGYQNAVFMVLYKCAWKAVMVFVVKLILENLYNSPCLKLNFLLLVSNITTLNTHAI